MQLVIYLSAYNFVIFFFNKSTVRMHDNYNTYCVLVVQNVTRTFLLTLRLP
jgi:hypothetical protein